MWQHYYKLSKQYYRKHGHLKIPRTYRGVNGEYLGIWIISMRRAYHEKMLSNEQIKKLEAIGMVWRM